MGHSWHRWRNAMTDSIGWLLLVAEEALLVVAFLVVFEGCRRLMRDGIARGPALMVAVALVLPVIDASASLRLIRSVDLLQARKQAALNLHGREPAGGWEKAPLSPEERTAASMQVAVMNYVFVGRRVDVVDSHGARVPLAPWEALERQREQFLLDEKGAADTARAAYDRGARLFIGTAGFLLAGLLVGRRQRARRVA
jgi:hypothetical protein